MKLRALRKEFANSLSLVVITPSELLSIFFFLIVISVKTCIILLSSHSFFLNVNTISSKPRKKSRKLHSKAVNICIEYTMCSKFSLLFSSSDIKYCFTISVNSFVDPSLLIMDIAFLFVNGKAAMKEY